MKPPSDSRNLSLLAGFVAALALLGGVAWLDWRHTTRMQEVANWVTRTQQVRDEGQLLSQLRDIETGARGHREDGCGGGEPPGEARREANQARPEQGRSGVPSRRPRPS